MNKDRGRLLAATVLISVATALGLLVARGQGLLQPLELIAYDLMAVLRPVPASEPLVTLVAVTEDDIARLRQWPLADETLSRALEALTAARPRVIGLDIYRDLPVPPGTDRLAALLEAERSIIGIYKFEATGSDGVRAHPVLAGEDRIGFSDAVLDDGAVVRRGLAFLDDGRELGWAFSLKLALEYLAGEGIGLTPDPAEPEHFRLGGATFVPLGRDFGGYVNLDNAGYQYMIDYARGSHPFPRFTLAELQEGQVPVAALRDRVVIVGVDAESVKDTFATPLGQWAWSEDPNMAGIELHGHLTDLLLRAALDGDRPLGTWPRGVEWLLVFAACLAGGFAGLAVRSETRLFVVGTAGVMAIAAVGYGLMLWQVWLPAVPMAGGWAISASLVTGYQLQRAARDRAALRRLLSLQVSPRVAAELWERRDELLEHGVLKPQQLVATVMFVDLRGFTALSESLPPDELLGWLDGFMRMATQTVLAHDGMVDDYFGDGIKANFGVPVHDADHARRAVDCALALADGAQRSSVPGKPPYTVRIGIHTGPLIAGSVGSSERVKYTSIGDTVNVAARLETHAKETMAADETESRILVSAATAQALGEAFELVGLGAVALRGKAQLVTVFQVVGRRSGEVPAALEQRG